jgi:hypothetical protein
MLRVINTARSLPAGFRSIFPIVVCLFAAGWFGGSVATGQRGIGLSLAWLLPTVVAVVIVVVAMVVATIVAGRTFPRIPAELAVASVVVGCLFTILWVSDGLNHAWATSLRARLVTMAPLALAVVLAMGWRLGRMTVGLVNRIGVLGSIGVGAMTFFVATASGRLVTPDEWTTYAAAVGLVEHGRPVVFDGEPYRFTLTGTVPPARPAAADIPAWAPGKFSLLPSLVIAPFYGVARLAGAPIPTDAAQAMPGDRAPELVTLLVGPICGAGAVMATALLARAANVGLRASVVVAMAVATGSLLWPYASTLMNLSITGGSLAVAVVATLRARQSGRLIDFASIGFLLGIASSTRYEFIILSLPLWLMCTRVAWVSNGKQDLRSSSMRLREFTLRQMSAVGAWLVVCGPLVFSWNFVRTGSIVDFGYGGEGFLSSVLDKPWYGWFGLFMSAGCGLFVHAPLVVIAFMSIAFLWEDDEHTAWVVAGFALISCLYYGSVSSTWCAQPAWGPRYMTSLMPVLFVPIGSLWARLSATGSPWRRNPFAWLAFGVPWAANVVVNLLAVLVDFSRGWQDHWALGVTYQTAAWVPYFSGVTAHVRLLRGWLAGGESSIDVHWLRGSAGTPTLAGAASMGVLLLLAAAFAGRAWKLAEKERVRE